MIRQRGILRIFRSRLRHNLDLLGARAGKATLCPVIKANAYGHGAGHILHELLQAGVKWFCYYSLEEVAELAHPIGSGADWTSFLHQHQPAILILAPLVVPPNDYTLADGRIFGEGHRSGWLLSSGSFRFNIVDVCSAMALDELARGCERVVPVHIQVDTGLTRMGVLPGELGALVEAIVALPNLKLEGVFAHFSHGDVAGHATVGEQLRVLKAATEPLKRRFPELVVHCQNSGGAWHLGDAGLDMVRVGIALYGLQPSTAEPIAGLLPIAEVTAPVLAVHERPAGVGVGYGHTFVTQRASRLAVVPVGYADGYPRAMSNRGVAQVRGVDVPVVGRVSMDQIIVDVTDVAGVGVGEVVTVISGDPAKPNCLDKMADAVGTIGYELATHLGGRLRRVVVE